MKFLGKVKGELFLVLLVISFLCPSDAFGWRRIRRWSPPVKRVPIRRPPVRSPPPRTPYCPLDARIKNIVDKKRVGREIQEFKRGTTWPYNCLHASILEDGGKFTIFPPIFSCCNSCSFPAFSNCIRQYGTSPNWRCPSQGIQCIVKCVRTHKPTTTPTTTPTRRRVIRKRFRTARVSRVNFRRIVRVGGTKPTSKNPKCERKVKRGGKYCIERLCIPIKLT